MQIFKDTFKDITFQEIININNLKIIPIQLEGLRHDDRIVPFDDLYDKGLAKAEEVSDEATRIYLPGPDRKELRRWCAHRKQKNVLHST